MAKTAAGPKTLIEIAPGVYKRIGKCTSDEIDAACELWEERMRPTARASLIASRFYESVLRRVRVSELARLDSEPLFAWAVIADEAARFHIPQEAAFEIMRRKLGLQEDPEGLADDAGLGERPLTSTDRPRVLGRRAGEPACPGA